MQRVERRRRRAEQPVTKELTGLVFFFLAMEFGAATRGVHYSSGSGAISLVRALCWSAGLLVLFDVGVTRVLCLCYTRILWGGLSEVMRECGFSTPSRRIGFH